MTLAELQPGETAIIDQVSAPVSDSALGCRLTAMGLSANRSVQVLRRAALGGPLHVRIGATTEVAIRRREADNILIRNVAS